MVKVIGIWEGYEEDKWVIWGTYHLHVKSNVVKVNLSMSST